MLTNDQLDALFQRIDEMGNPATPNEVRALLRQAREANELRPICAELHEKVRELEAELAVYRAATDAANEEE